MKSISSQNAITLDQTLFEKSGFSIDQLMELAGLSVSQAVYKCYPPRSYPKILILSGPGNNGGDGLVAARHLSMFGYKPTIIYLKKSKGQLFDNLLKQLEFMHIPIVKDKFDQHFEDCSCIIDSLFGFSFMGPVRDPFKGLVKKLFHCKKPVIAVDVPSSWNVDKPEPCNNYIPNMLISLSVPKPCSKYFANNPNTIHFLGGRFIPQNLALEMKLDLSVYEGQDQYADISKLTIE